MVDGYEMGSYEWPSMPLYYSLICTLTAIHLLRCNAYQGGTAMRVPLALSSMPEVACLLEYPISSTLMPEVVELVACLTFRPIELGSLI